MGLLYFYFIQRDFFVDFRLGHTSRMLSIYIINDLGYFENTMPQVCRKTLKIDFTFSSNCSKLILNRTFVC